MEFDNATNLDRKSGVRGTKKTGEAPPLLLVALANFTRVSRSRKSGVAQWRDLRFQQFVPLPRIRLNLL